MSEPAKALKINPWDAEYRQGKVYNLPEYLREGYVPEEMPSFATGTSTAPIEELQPLPETARPPVTDPFAPPDAPLTPYEQDVLKAIQYEKFRTYALSRGWQPLV